MKLACALLTLSSATVLLAQPALLAQTGSHPAAPAKPATQTTPSAGAATSAVPAPTPIPPVAGTPAALYSLRYIDVVVGTGPIAVPRKYYTVQYTGWLTDGTKFDSSYDRGEPGKGEPITFPYGAHQVIAGWDTGFEGMHVGGKRRLYIPYQLAYGESGRPPVIPAKADLTFDIELLGLADSPPEPTPVPTPAADPSSKPEATTPASKQPSASPQ